MYQQELSVIVASIIFTQHGWSVAGQFQDTFEEKESFEEQNKNALRYIRKSVQELIESNTFSPQGEEDLREYLNKLENYLGK